MSGRLHFVHSVARVFELCDGRTDWHTLHLRNPTISCLRFFFIFFSCLFELEHFLFCNVFSPLSSTTITLANVKAIVEFYVELQYIYPYLFSVSGISCFEHSFFFYYCFFMTRKNITTKCWFIGKQRMDGNFFFFENYEFGH